MRKTAKASQKVFEEALEEAKSPKTSFCLSTDHSYYDTTYDNVEQDDWINPLKRKAEDDLTKECDTPVKKSTPLQVLDQNKSFDIVEIKMTANDAWVIQERPIVRVRSPNPIFKPSPTWGCEYCPEKFDDRDKMLRHKEDEHKKVTCGLCDELFYTEEEMKRHRKLNYDQNLCPICDEYVTDFKGHVIRVHATVEHECPVCHAKIQEVRSHLERHMGRYIHCHICSGRYVSESKRLSHLRNSACGQLSEIKILEMRGGDEHREKKVFKKQLI